MRRIPDVVKGPWTKRSLARATKTREIPDEKLAISNELTLLDWDFE